MNKFSGGFAWVFLLGLASFSFLGFADEFVEENCVRVVFEYSYHIGKRGLRPEADNFLASVPIGRKPYTTDPGIHRALAMVSLGNAIRVTLQAEEDNAESPLPLAANEDDSPRTLSSGLIMVMNSGRESATATREERNAARLRNVVASIRATDRRFPVIRDESGEINDKIEEALQVAEKLARNIEQGTSRGGDYEVMRGGGVPKGGVSRGMSFGLESMSVPELGFAGQGLQDWHSPKNTINRGKIPDAKDFTFEAFLRSFAFPLYNAPEPTLYMQPSPALYLDGDNLFVQVALDSAVGKTMEIPVLPKAVTFLLDVSGSMGTNDGLLPDAEKEGANSLTRIAGVIKYLKKVLTSQMGPNDLFSLVTFGTSAQELVPPTYVTPEARKSIFQKLNAILANHGGTNLGLGLNEAYRTADKARLALGTKKDEYVHRVMVLTDMESNEGLAPSEFQAITMGGAFKEVGISVVGVGHKFPSDLEDKLTSVPLGTSIFISNGAEMAGGVNRFHRMSTPALRDFLMDVRVEPPPGFVAHLLGTYGVNDETRAEGHVMSVGSHFFVDRNSDGGGTILVQFRLSRVKPE